MAYNGPPPIKSLPPEATDGPLTEVSNTQLCVACGGDGYPPGDEGVCQYCRGNGIYPSHLNAWILGQVMGAILQRHVYGKIVHEIGIRHAQLVKAIGWVKQWGGLSAADTAYLEQEMGLTPPALPIQKVQLAPVPTVVDNRPTIIEWKLRTLQGQPVLEITCAGQRAYKIMQVVNQDDYQHSAAGHKWRGTVKAATVYLFGGQVRQSVQIALEKHTLIENGTYKPRTVLASDPPKPQPTAAPSIAAQPAAPQIAAPALHERPRRKFHLE